MHHSPPFRILPLLLAVSLGAACTETETASSKMVVVANQTPDAHRVQFGPTDYGIVAADTETDYLEIPDGEHVILMDGRALFSTTLGSDNVGGNWTLFLQGSGDQLGFGVIADDE